MDEATHKVWCALCDKCYSSGYSMLTASEQTWLNVRSLIDSVQNGGLISYFYNGYADTFSDMMSALQHLDAEEVRIQVLRVAELFPNGVSASHIARNDVIESWPDNDSELERLLQDVDDKLEPLLDGLENKLTRFLRVQGVAT